MKFFKKSNKSSSCCSLQIEEVKPNNELKPEINSENMKAVDEKPVKQDSKCNSK